MHADIELAPLLLDLSEDRFQMTFRLKIEGHEDGGIEFLGEWLNKLFCLFVAISHRQISAEGAKRLGTAVSDRLVVGNPRNQRLLALEQRQG
jgi:hypothetical protein